MQHEDRRRVDVRLSGLQYVITIIFSILAVSFWVLQVVQHAKFRELAENNHQRTLPLRAPRGMVFDRDGHVLVENRYSYNISIVREQTKDLDRTVRLLAPLLNVDESFVQEIVDRHKREPVFRPIVVMQDASLPQVAAVSARHLELPEVIVEEAPTRRYPETMAAHLFGYVGEVSEIQVARDEELRSGDIVGKTGIELIYNDLLMGEDGMKSVTVNSIGREIPDRPRKEDTPVEGKRLQLTIDADVQRAVEDSFKAFGYNGAAVILDPRSGEVLAFSSLPAYDPNAFASGGIDRATWAALNSDDLKPLNNRATQGLYSPGSTFKMAVATAALEEGVITPDFRVYCSGAASFYGHSFKCHKAGGHGSVDLRHAIEKSCNVYFYTVGNMVGIDKIHKWATLLGLGEKTGIDLPNEVQGLVPSTEWKKQVKGEKWYAGETISVAIGQGAVSLTPVSMAVYISSLATGVRVTPHLLKAVDDGKGWKPVTAPPPKSTVELKAGTIQAIRDGLWMVVNEAGTGGRSRIPGKDVSGKTGTAQVISIEGAKAAKGRTTRDLRDHGWFVFFAPRDNPQIAGVIFAEHAEHGTNAAPIAKQAIETFFAKQENRPLPPPIKPQPPPPVPAVERPVAVNTASPAGSLSGATRSNPETPVHSADQN